MEDDSSKFVDLPPQILADHCYGKPTPPPPAPTAPSLKGSPAPAPVDAQLQQIQQQQQILIRQPPTILTEAHIHHQQQQHQESLGANQGALSVQMKNSMNRCWGGDQESQHQQNQQQQHTVHHHPTFAQQQAHHHQHRVYVPQNLVTIPAQGGAVAAASASSVAGTSGAMDWRTAPIRANPSAIVVGTVATHHVSNPVMIHHSSPQQQQQQFVAMVGGASSGANTAVGGGGAQVVSSLSPTSIFADGFPVIEPVSVAPGDGAIYGSNMGAFPTVEINQGGGFQSASSGAASAPDEKSTKDESGAGSAPAAAIGEISMVPTVSLATAVSNSSGASNSSLMEKLPANILEGDEIELTDTSSGGNGGIL